MFWSQLLAVVLGIMLLTALGLLLTKPLLSYMSKVIITATLTKNPKENAMLSHIYTILNTSPVEIIEINQRAATGKAYHMPSATHAGTTILQNLKFNPVQIASVPTAKEVPVNLTTVVGPMAKKPMVLACPVMIGGMAAMVGLTPESKQVLCQVASLMGTSISSGHSGFSREERKTAKLYCAQYGSGTWAKSTEHLAEADMIEIFVGQGANPSIPWTASYAFLDDKGRKQFNVTNGSDADFPGRYPEINVKEDWHKLVKHLKKVSESRPISVKLTPSNRLEDDLAILVDAGVDGIILDGAEGGTGSSPELSIRSFGLPLAYALPRASIYLEKRKVKENITLVASGGIRTSSDILKALALGADSVYICSAILIALLHTQVTKVVPWKPGFTSILAGSKDTARFDPDAAKDSLHNFLLATKEEIEGGIRALGKTSAKELTSDDLMCLDKETATLTHVPYIHKKSLL